VRRLCKIGQMFVPTKMYITTRGNTTATRSTATSRSTSPRRLSVEKHTRHRPVGRADSAPTTLLGSDSIIVIFASRCGFESHMESKLVYCAFITAAVIALTQFVAAEATSGGTGTVVWGGEQGIFLISILTGSALPHSNLDSRQRTVYSVEGEALPKRTNK
jgi:hypothetical protein